MDDVKVHYNSPKPAQLNAHAYAQGTDIHVASGQEKHLPHEAWHVVQQKQGRVQPTVQMKGNVAVNDDPGLEHEADAMGAKAVQMKKIIQRRIFFPTDPLLANIPDIANAVFEAAIVIYPNINNKAGKTFISKMIATGTGNYTSVSTYLASVAGKLQSYNDARASSAIADSVGGGLEQAAAAAYGGVLGNAKTGQDLQWRELDEEGKAKIKDKYPNYSLEDVMINFSALATELKLPYKKSTPVDVYRITGKGLLCIAGGGAKFDRATGLLLEHTKVRMNEVIKISESLDMIPAFVFNKKTVTPEQFELVKELYGGRCSILLLDPAA
jgi:hypothetical protein